MPRSNVGIAVALTLGLSAVSLAQTDPGPQWSVVTNTQIKPEFRMEYEAVQKELMAAYKKAGVPYRMVVQTLLGDLTEYTSITPMAKYADLDGPTPLVKALGEAGSQRLLKRVGGYMVGIHRSTMLEMPEISIDTPTENPGEFVEISIYRLYPGKGAEFAAFMKDDYLPVMRKADVANLWVHRPIYGADRDERVVVRPLHKLADLDGGPLTTKVLGAEGAQQLLAKRSRIVQSSHYSVGRIRADLSYMPPPPKPKPAE